MYASSYILYILFYIIFSSHNFSCLCSVYIAVFDWLIPRGCFLSDNPNWLRDVQKPQESKEMPWLQVNWQGQKPMDWETRVADLVLESQEPKRTAKPPKRRSRDKLTECSTTKLPLVCLQEILFFSFLNLDSEHQHTCAPPAVHTWKSPKKRRVFYTYPSLNAERIQKLRPIQVWKCEEGEAKELARLALNLCLWVSQFSNRALRIPGEGCTGFQSNPRLVERK